MNKTTKPPAVGVATIILNENKILIGRRLNAPMSGSWQLPGGWIHSGESPEEATIRIITAFKGLRCDKADFVTYTNNLFASGLHSLSLYFEMHCLKANAMELGSNKDCSDWFWADWYDLPQPLFYPLQLLIDSGYKPFTGE